MNADQALEEAHKALDYFVKAIAHMQALFPLPADHRKERRANLRSFEKFVERAIDAKIAEHNEMLRAIFPEGNPATLETLQEVSRALGPAPTLPELTEPCDDRPVTVRSALEEISGAWKGLLRQYTR